MPFRSRNRYRDRNRLFHSRNRANRFQKPIAIAIATAIKRFTERFETLSLYTIFYNSSGQLRAGWLILIYVVLASACTAATAWGYGMLVRLLLPGRAAIVMTGANAGLYIFLLLGILPPAFLMIRWAHGKPFGSLGFSLHDRIWIEWRQGIIQGALMISAIFLLEWSTNGTHARWSGMPPLSIIRSGVHYTRLLALAAAFEEALMRGYAFQMLIRGTSKATAVIASSLIFGAAHLYNPNWTYLSFANTVLAGVWLSVAYLKTRSLWLPTSVHMTWNLSQGFIYGFPVSGIEFPNSLLRITSGGKTWVTGGSYGPEGGILAICVLVPSIVYLLYSKRVRPSPKAQALWDGP